MLKKASDSILASLRGSTYRNSTTRPFARCGLARRPFWTSSRSLAQPSAIRHQPFASMQMLMIPHKSMGCQGRGFFIPGEF